MCLSSTPPYRMFYFPQMFSLPFLLFIFYLCSYPTFPPFSPFSSCSGSFQMLHPPVPMLNTAGIGRVVFFLVPLVLLFLIPQVNTSVVIWSVFQSKEWWQCFWGHGAKGSWAQSPAPLRFEHHLAHSTHCTHSVMFLLQSIVWTLQSSLFLVCFKMSCKTSGMGLAGNSVCKQEESSLLSDVVT